MSFPEIKKELFNKKTELFFDTLMNSFDTDYRGTDWSALQAFSKKYPLIYFNEISKSSVLEFKNELLIKATNHWE